MAKKIIALILMISTAALIGCSKSDNIANSRLIVANDTSNNNIEVNQKKALKLYNKYLPKIKAVFDTYGLNAKNLNENIDDTEFVSRLVYNKSEDDVDNSIETIWYGLVYDENNLIESVNFYVDCNISDIKEESKGVELRDTFISDIGKIFFKNTTFNKDVVSAVDNFLTTETVEPVAFQYKKGNVELVVRQHKLTMNISLNLN